MLGDPGRNFKTFSTPVPQIPKHHFCHILLIKQVTKARADTRGEGLDSASYWWSVRITFETSMWNEDYHCSYLWASLIVQLVKNPPAMQETLIQFLGREHPLEKVKATHSSIVAWRTHHGLYRPWCCKELDMTE